MWEGCFSLTSLLKATKATKNACLTHSEGSSKNRLKSWIKTYHWKTYVLRSVFQQLWRTPSGSSPGTFPQAVPNGLVDATVSWNLPTLETGKASLQQPWPTTCPKRGLRDAVACLASRKVANTFRNMVATMTRKDLEIVLLGRQAQDAGLSSDPTLKISRLVG